MGQHPAQKGILNDRIGVEKADVVELKVGEGVPEGCVGDVGLALVFPAVKDVGLRIVFCQLLQHF